MSAPKSAVVALSINTLLTEEKLFDPNILISIRYKSVFPFGVPKVPLLYSTDATLAVPILVPVWAAVNVPLEILFWNVSYNSISIPVSRGRCPIILLIVTYDPRNAEANWFSTFEYAVDLSVVKYVDEKVPIS